MLNIIKGLAKTAICVVTLPVDIAADAVTLLGAMTDKPEPYTITKIKKAMDGIDEATK